MNIFAVSIPFHPEYLLWWVVLYIGPDVFLPLTSALAAIVGFVLMFWQRLIAVVLRIVGRTPAHSEEAPKPSAETAHHPSDAS
jgi:hypothetical protein